MIDNKKLNSLFDNHLLIFLHSLISVLRKKNTRNQLAKIRIIS